MARRVSLLQLRTKALLWVLRLQTRCIYVMGGDIDPLHHNSIIVGR